MKKVSFLFALFMILALAMAACGPAEEAEGTPGASQTEVFGTDTGLETSTPALPETGKETGTPMATVEPTENLASPTDTLMPTATTESLATATPGLEISGTETVTGTPGIPTTGMADPSRVSQLLDFTVEDQSGAKLGEVDDLVLNLGSRCLNYVILSPESSLALENEFVAVPWEGVSVRGSNEVVSDQVLVVNVDAGTLKSVPGFKTGGEPDFTKPDWDMDWRDFWSTHISGTVDITGTGTTTGTMGADCSLSSQNGSSGAEKGMGPDRTIMAKEFLGTNVQDNEGNSLGEVEDVVIDIKTGEIRYFIVSAGGFLGIGEKLIPVPPMFFTYAATGDEFLTLNVNVDVLSAAPTFDLDKLPGSSAAGWDSSIKSYWDQQTSGSSTGEMGTPEATATKAP